MSFAVMPLEDYKNICDKVREKTGSEEAIKSGELAGEVEKVFEAGKEAENKRFFDAVLSGRRNSNGTINAGSMCRYWQKEMFYPPKNETLIITGPNSMFDNFGVYDKKEPFDLVARLEERNTVIDFSRSQGVLSYVFYKTTMQRLPVLAFINGSTSLNNTFNGSNLLESIEKLIVKDGMTDSAAFNGCTSLVHMILEVVNGGKIKGTWNFSYTKLDPESMKSIILCLYDYSGTDEEGVYSILFPEPCWEALEADSTAPDGGTWGNYVLKLGYLK